MTISFLIMILELLMEFNLKSAIEVKKERSPILNYMQYNKTLNKKT